MAPPTVHPSDPAPFVAPGAPPPPSPHGPVGSAEHAAPPPDPADRSRSGALWVTATGAFLLVAAAAVFIGVRWGTLGEQAKLGILVGATAAAGVAGRWLRRSVPVAAGVLTHLAAALVPLDVAAVALHVAGRADVDPLWPPVLALSGTAAALTWWLIGRIERSRWLEAGAALAVVPAVVGASAMVGLPVGLALCAAAGVALVVGRDGRAALWAVVGGTLPSLVAVAEVADLSVVTSSVQAGTAGPAALVTGLASAGVLGAVAHRHRRPELLPVALLAVVLGAIGLRTDVAVSGATDLLAVAAIFAGVELAATLVRRDPFWSGPADGVAVASEVLVGLGLPAVGLGVAASAGLDGSLGATWLAAACLVAVGWVLAGLRRTAIAAAPDGGRAPATAWHALVDGARWVPVTPMVVASVLVGVLASTTGAIPVGLVALGLAAAAVGIRAPLGDVLAAPLGLVGVALVGSDGTAPVVVAAAVAATAVLVAAGCLRHRTGGRDDQAWSWLLVAVALVPVPLAAGQVDLGLAWGTAATVATWAACSWMLDVALGRGGAPTPAALLRAGAAGAVAFAGLVVAEAAVTGMAGAPVPFAASTAVVAGLASLWLVGDAVGNDDAPAATALGATLPVLVAGLLWAAGFGVAEVGVGLAALALALGCLGLLVPMPWRVPTRLVASVPAIAGLLLSWGDPAAAGTVLLLVGGWCLAEAVVERSGWLAAGSGLAMVLGAWAHLDAAGVQSLDAWVAPVAAALLVAGVLADREGASSWLAYAPPLVLVGSTAVLERLAGGSGAHAVVAGVVGVVAVVAGGAHRRAAPLLVGTALLVAVVVVEALGHHVGVPTWAWLALGGSALLGSGIALERHESGPVELGERLVDVLQTRYR